MCQNYADVEKKSKENIIKSIRSPFWTKKTK